MIRNWHLMTRRLTLGAGVLLAGFGTTGDAPASVIATSLNNLTNYDFSGTPGGPTVLESPNHSTSSDSAAFNGAGPMNTVTCPGPGSPPCNPGGLSANAPQATAGPGPFPPENTFTKPPPGGFVGSRGDANVTSVSFGVPPSGAGASNVADSRLNGPGTGAANGTNSIATNVTLTGSTSLNFSFVADPFMQVAVGQAGDSATAVLGAQITLVAGGGTTIFLWTPGVSIGEIGVASESDPFSLNQSLAAHMPADNATFSPVVNPTDVFRASSVVLPAGDYTLTLQMTEGVSAAEIAVPEPSTLLLVSAGLLGLAAWRRRNTA
jgi:hypothetical protein